MGCLKLTYDQTFPLLKVTHSDFSAKEKKINRFFISEEKSSAGKYRYSFQGQESDDEIKGAGNSLSYKYRMHDPRLGRFFAVDPLTAGYPHYSPYSFSGNKVIAFVELEGLEERLAIFIGSDFKQNEKSLAEQGFTVKVVKTGRELIEVITAYEGIDKFEKLVIVSHGFLSSMLIGDGHNVGVYTIDQFQNLARSEAEAYFSSIGYEGDYDEFVASVFYVLASLEMHQNGAVTFNDVGEAIKKVGVTEDFDAILLGGCNTVLSSETCDFRKSQNADWEEEGGNFYRSDGGGGGVLSTSSGLDVIGSSPVVKQGVNSKYEVTGSTQPYPKNSSSTSKRQSSTGGWTRSTPSGENNSVNKSSSVIDLGR